MMTTASKKLERFEKALCTLDWIESLAREQSQKHHSLDDKTRFSRASQAIGAARWQIRKQYFAIKDIIDLGSTDES